MTPTNMSLCTFRLGDLHIGVDVTLVQEVMRSQKTTKVPLASEMIHGLINLRGEIVTTIDLRRRLGLPPRVDVGRPMNVVIRTADGPVALLVDEIDDVIDADESLFELAPPTLTGVHREFITGVFKVEQSLLLLIDLDRVLDVTTFDSDVESALSRPVRQQSSRRTGSPSSQLLESTSSPSSQPTATSKTPASQKGHSA
jgi:purine-binding chemotaxis protein CheW